MYEVPVDRAYSCGIRENIGSPGFETLSLADATVCSNVANLVNDVEHPVVAEIGVGIGATTLELARILDNRGELHLYDFTPS